MPTKTYRKIADRQKFAKGVEAILLGLGAIKQPLHAGILQCMYEWQLQTRFGLLILNIETDYTESLGTIFTRFTASDLTEVAKYTGCNPYSGKWNHHYFTTSLQTALDDFSSQLKGVI